MLKRFWLWACLLLLPALSSAQPLDRAGLDALTQQYAPDSYAMLHALLSIPNDAHDPDHLQRNLAWVREAFAQRGFMTTELSSEGFPLLLAERSVEDAARTVLVERLRDELGADRIPSSRPQVERALRSLLYVILSSPEYQLA